MSCGLVCLTCRKYIAQVEWGCKCTAPVPSLDAKTPCTPEQAIAAIAQAEREERA